MPPIPRRIANVNPKAWMPMNMKLPVQERANGVDAATTLDAIISGDRTATTRKNYGDLQTMRRLQPGDAVGFYDTNTGNTAMARVNSRPEQVNPLVVSDRDERDALLQNWATSEGRNMRGAREHLYGTNSPRVINVDLVDADLATQNQRLATALDSGDTATAIQAQKTIDDLKNYSKFTPAPEGFHRTGLGGSGYQMEYEFIPGSDRSQSLLPPEQQSRIAAQAYQEPTIDFTPGPEYKDVNYRMHPTGRQVTPIPDVLLDNGGKHHEDVRVLIKGERLPQFKDTHLNPLPTNIQGDKFVPYGKTLHDTKYIRKINQAAGYSDQPALAWERANVNGLSEEAALYSVPTSDNFYSLDQAVRRFDSATRAVVSGKSNGLDDVVGDVYQRPATEQEIYARNPLTAVGQRDVLVSDQGRINDAYRQELGERVPLNVQRVRPDLPRSTMPESDLLDAVPQHRFAEQRNIVHLPPQSISSLQEQAAIRAGLEMDTPQPLGSFTMNTRSMRTGEMPEMSPIEGAYLSDGKGYKPYTPSADKRQRYEELNDLLIDVGGSKVPYVAGASVDIAGKEYPRNADLMPDAIDAIAQAQQKYNRLNAGFLADVASPTTTYNRARQGLYDAEDTFEYLAGAEDTLRAVQAIDPAHNIASQGFDVSVDVAPGKATTQAYNALKRHGLSVDVGGSDVNNVLSASGELPVDQQVELARSLRSTLNPTGGMMGLADADPEMAGLREQWKRRKEAMAVDPIRQAKVDNAIARVRAENGLGMMKPPAPRQTIEVLNEDNMPRPIARRSRRVDDDWLGIAEPSMADLGIPSKAATPPQQGFTLVGSPATVLSTSRPPRSAAETFFQQNYGVPQERALVPSPQARTFTSDLPPAQPEEIPSRALIPYRGQGLSTNAQFDFAPGVDWREAPTMPGEMGQQPNWIIPSAIAGGVLGAGALGYGIYNSKQEEEQRKRSAAGW